MQGLGGGHPAAAEERPGEEGLKDPLAQLFVEPGARRDQDPHADPFQPAEHQKEKDGDQREHQQRGLTPAHQDPIVHGQHVDRRHQHQEIDEEAEERGVQKRSPAGGQGPLQIRRLAGARRCGGE